MTNHSIAILRPYRAVNLVQGDGTIFGQGTRSSCCLVSWKGPTGLNTPRPMLIALWATHLHARIPSPQQI